MPSANRTNNLPLLKRLWGNDISKPYYAASKLLARCKKDTKFGAEGRYVNMSLSPTKGGSATFNDALAAQDATTEARFFVTPKKEYQVYSVQGDLIATSQGNANALVDAFKHNAGRARDAHARAMSRRLWGNGGGSIGQIHGSTSLATLTLLLRSRADELGVDQGMQLEFASDDGSAASPAGRRSTGGVPDRVTVGTINRSANPRSMTVTCANAGASLTAGVNGITVNDYVFRRGDYAAAFTGIRGWHPTTTPTTGDSFFGYDRSTADVQRACGMQYNGAGAAKEEVLVDASAEGGLKGLDMTDIYVNPLDLAGLIKELGSKVTVDMKSRDGSVGFKGVSVNLASGEATAMGEADVPLGFFWMMNPDNVYLRTAGDCPRSLIWDGRGMELIPDDDGVRGRIGCYGNFTDEEPGLALAGTW